MSTIKKSTANLSPLDNIFGNNTATAAKPTNQVLGKKRAALDTLDNIFGSSDGNNDNNKPFEPAWQAPKPVSGFQQLLNKTGEVVKKEASKVNDFFSPNYGFNTATKVNTSTPEIIKNPKPGTVKISGISDFLGGGAYNNVLGKPNALVNTGHTTYGGEESVAGQQRDDIFPVGLAGSNQSPTNIKLTNLKDAKKLDELETQLAKDYKAGKISLRAAQLQILTAKQRTEDKLDTNPHSLNNIFGGLGDMVKQGADSVKNVIQTDKNAFNDILSKNKTVKNAADWVKEGITNSKNPVASVNTGMDIFNKVKNTVVKKTVDYGKGNIDLNNRPIVKNSDGSISTVRSVSYNLDGKEVLIPTVRQGLDRIMTNDEALAWYKKTGENLGKFNTPEEADKYAEQLHNDQAKLYADNSIAPDVKKLAQNAFGIGVNKLIDLATPGKTNNPLDGFIKPLADKPFAPLAAGVEAYQAIKQKEYSTSVWKNLPQAIIDNLPLGVGEVFQTAGEMNKDDIQQLKDSTSADFLKAGGETLWSFAKGIITTPIRMYGGIMMKDKVKVPLLGEVESYGGGVTKDMDTYIGQGMSPTGAAITATIKQIPNIIFDVLLMAGVAEKVAKPKETTILTSKVKLFEKSNVLTDAKGKADPTYVYINKNTPMGADVHSAISNSGAKYNPELQTLLKVEYTPEGMKGSIVQIKPSILNRSISLSKAKNLETPLEPKIIFQNENVVDSYVVPKETVAGLIGDLKKPTVPLAPEIPTVPVVSPTSPSNVAPTVNTPVLPTPTPANNGAQTINHQELPNRLSSLDNIFSASKPIINDNVVPAVQDWSPITAESNSTLPARVIPPAIKMENLVIKKPNQNDIYLEKSGDSYLFQAPALKKIINVIKGQDVRITDNTAFSRASVALQQANQAFASGQNTYTVTEISGNRLHTPIRLVKSELKGKLPEDIKTTLVNKKTANLPAEDFKYTGWPSELTNQYNNFKTLLNKIPNPIVKNRLISGDAETFKRAMINSGKSSAEVDNMLYSQNLSNHEVFSKFLDRYDNRNTPMPDNAELQMRDYYDKLEADELLKEAVVNEISQDLNVDDVWGNLDKVNDNKLDSLINKTEESIKQYEADSTPKVEAKTSTPQKNESLKAKTESEPHIEGDISVKVEERANQEWEDKPEYGDKVGELVNQTTELGRDLTATKGKVEKENIQNQIDKINTEINTINEDFVKKWEDIAKQEKRAANNIFAKRPTPEISYPNKYPEAGVKVFGHVKDGVAKLDSIEIIKAKQSQGLGTKYVAEFEKWAKEHGAKILEIDAYKGSTGFWEKKDFNLAKDFPTDKKTGVVQDYKPGVKSLEVKINKDIDPRIELAKQYKIFEKKIPKPEDLTPNISIEQAKVELSKLFSSADISLITHEFGSVYPYDKTQRMGIDLAGYYYTGVISVVQNNGLVSNRTLYHESFHHYINTYHPILDAGNLLAEAYKENKTFIDKNYSEYGEDVTLRSEEYLADLFADYLAKSKTFSGRIENLFNSIQRHIRGLLGKLTANDKARNLFDKIIAGQAKEMNPKAVGLRSRDIFQKKTQPSSEDLSSEQRALVEEANAEIAKIPTKIPVPLDIQAGIPYWIDKPALFLTRETMERNIDDVAGDHAPAIKDFLTEPIKRNETSRAIFVDALRTEIENYIVKQLGIKKGSNLSSLVQKFGEGEMLQDELMTKTDKWPQVIEASTYLRKVYDNILDMWNGVRTSYGYEPVPKRPDYFRHGEFIASISKQFGMIFAENDLPTSISGVTYIFKPGTPFSTAALKRTGVTTDYDAVAGMDNYIDAVSRSIFHTDSVQRGRALENIIRKGSEIIEGKNISAEHRIPEIVVPHFVANLNEYTNLISGKKSQFDRSFESVFGRGIYGVASFITKRTGANMIGGNIASAITNFIPITQLLATTGKVAVVRGLAEVSKGIKNNTIIDGQVSGFLIRRFNKESIGMSGFQKANAALNSMFKFVDLFTSRWTVAAKYYENLSKGMNKKQALLAADNYASRVITDRSIGQLPNLFGIKTLRMVTQFQTEINGQYSFMTKDMPEMSQGKKLHLLSMIVQFILYSYLFNQLYEKIIGRRPAIDPIYDAMTLAGQTVDGRKKTVGQNLFFVAKDISGNLPFTGSLLGGRLPVSAGIPDFAAINTGQSTWQKEISKPLFLIASPVAGNQVKKTWEGVKAYDAGGSYSSSGVLQYPIDQTPANRIKTTIFGKSSTGDSTLYYGEGRSVLGKSQTKEYQRLLVNSPLQARPYYDRVIQLREKKAEAKNKAGEAKKSN